ncbi:hypothetical protein [Romboutsia sp. 1001285H_161024_C4]|uniref:hypothetical protein n=1 Tax=Romboutsia sp. 1001285H_161024_C4 TaxID=2787109 RepID=UPI001A9A8089|nr:hypothetical protein [Romboutsia sp. 1001285H_161024_C4]
MTFLNKVKSIKLSDFIEINNIKQDLSYYQIIPHQSTRNYKSVEIAKVINSCYSDISKRIVKLEKDFKYDFEYKSPTKVAYYTYVSKNKGIEFYLIVPTVYAKMFLEKLSISWDKVEVKKVNDIPRFSDECSKISMEYTRDDALSLNIIDKKSNDILYNQLNIIDMMHDGENVGIYYNFNYKSEYLQRGFKEKYNKTMEKIKDGKSIDKIKVDMKTLRKFLLRTIVLTGEEIMKGLAEILGEKRKTSTDMNIINKSLGILQKKDLSKHTKEKSQLDIISTQILLMSESSNKDHEKTNIRSLAQSFNVLDGDNELRPKIINIKRKIDLDKTKLPIASNDMSVEEVGSLISQPGKEIIKKHNIKANSINEEDAPRICKEGYISTGTITKKGKVDKAYLNPNPDQDTGLVVVGKQGSGKTEYLKNYSNSCIKHNDSLVVLDYIANNDLASTVEKVVSKDKLVVLDLSKRDGLQALAYNELYYTEDMDTMDKLDIIGSKSQYSAELINAISVGQDLTSAMRRFFMSAANVTYAVNQFASFKDIIDCLEIYNTRMNFIANIPSEFKDVFEDDVNNLLKLNDKYTKGDLKGQDNGETNEGKIDRILDRISVMRESMRTKYMFNKSPEDNINFEECFKEGKVILIKMRQDLFGAKHIKNMLSLFFTTKVWISIINRKSKASEEEELRRVHLLIDEPHQVPQVTNLLSPELPQMRKFRLKPVFATQSLLQLENIQDDMKSAGFSYMLLAGSDKVNYNLLKEELHPYEVDDLKNLERFYSLNLIPDEKGVLRPFITHLPPELKSTTLLHQEEEKDIESKSKIIEFSQRMSS